MLTNHCEQNYFILLLLILKQYQEDVYVYSQRSAPKHNCSHEKSLLQL